MFDCKHILKCRNCTVHIQTKDGKIGQYKNESSPSVKSNVYYTHSFFFSVLYCLYCAIVSSHPERVIDKIADHKRSRWGCNNG